MPRLRPDARRLAPAILAAAFLFIACGGSDPGRGSRTLHVEAVAYTEGTRDSTRFMVVVREGGSSGRQLTDDVRVRIRGRDEGDWRTLPYEGIDWGPFVAGAHHRSGIDWQSGFYLEVERSDEDWLEAYLEFPGHTRITEPVSGTAYRNDPGLPLSVRWEDDRNRRAEEVRIELNRNDYEVVLLEDSRRHDIPANVFGRTGTERVTIFRSNEVELAGGTRGSYFEAITRHRIEFVVE
jgi:hypothetical protein